MPSRNAAPNRNTASRSTTPRNIAPSFDPRAIRADGQAAASDAAQFIPFAALRGLADLFQDREDRTTAEPRHTLTPEECQALSHAARQLRRGQQVTCSVYDGRRYATLCDVVTRVDLPCRTMYLEGRRVLLDDVRTLRIEGVPDWDDAPVWDG